MGILLKSDVSGSGYILFKKNKYNIRQCLLKRSMRHFLYKDPVISPQLGLLQVDIL